MNIASSKTAPLLLLIVEAIAKFRLTPKPQVAEGYQDAGGFHYGVKPAEKQIAWPPVE